MGWEVLIPLIAKYGLPLAEELFKQWTAGGAPTQADFDTLRGLAAQNATDRAKAELADAGVALDSKQAQDLVALTGGQS